MKTVISSEEVCHYWANQVQEHGRNTNSTLSFEGGVLKSYRTPIALLVEDKVLWSNAHYSATTSKHQTYAMRSLSRTQRENILYVDELESSYHVATMAVLQERCAASIGELIASIGVMRSVPRMEEAFNKAKEYEKTGQWLKARTKVKWAVTKLPDTLPAPKEDRLAMVKAFSLVFLKEKLVKQVEELKQINGLLFAAIHEPFGRRVSRHTAKDLATGHRLYGQAAATQNLISPRKNPTLTKLKNEFMRLEALALPLIADAVTEEAKNEIEYHLNRAHQLEERGHPLQLRGLRTAFAAYRETEHKAEIERLGMLEDIQKHEQEVTSLKGYAETVRAMMPDKPANALACWRDIKLSNSRLPEPYHNPKLHQEALVQIEVITPIVMALQADCLRAWQACESNVRPSSAIGVQARINGDYVETTLGAKVVIEDAKKLAKLAKRAIDSKKDYDFTSESVKIGVYRLESISSEGRIVIGCHEFEPEVVVDLIGKLA